MIVEGQIVRSAAGRDAGRFFMVVSLEGAYVFIADGSLRRLEKPKKKKLRHLARTNRILPVLDITTNKQLRAALAAFNTGNEPVEGGDELV